MSSSNSPCAACKFLRRKCTQECVLAPYFPPDQPQRFVNIHKVFGNSNVTKILNELPVSQREEAVNSLAYEAESRLSDPVYGCVGLISYLQQMLKKLDHELETSKSQLASYTGGQAGLGPMFQNMYLHHSHNLPHNGRGGGQFHHHHSSNVSGPPSFSGGGGGGVLSSNPNYMLQYNMAQMMGTPDKGRTSGITGFDMGDNQPQPLQTVNHNRSNGGMMMRESNLLLFNDNNPNSNNQNPNDGQDDNILTAQHLVAAMQDKEEHELMRNLGQQQQQQQTSPPLNQEQQQAEQFLTFSGNGNGLHDSGPGGLMMGGGSNSDHSSGVTVGGSGGRSFGHMVHNNNSSHVVDMPPSLALGTGFDTASYHQEQQQHQQHDQTPLMLFQPMDSHQHSPNLELNRAAAIPQQFFQECPGTVGRGFGESRNNSSTATSG